MARGRMGEALVEEILAASGAPVEGHGLSVQDMQAAVREGRVLEVYYWSHFGDGEASFGFAEDFGVDIEGKVAHGYLVFPKPIPVHLRGGASSDWEKPADVEAAFGIGARESDSARPGAAKAEHDRALLQRCSICSQLSDHERGFQKITGEEEDTFLPPAADLLEVVADLKPSTIRLPGPEGGTPAYFDIPSSRLLQLKRCPECGTYYLYRTDYEFLPMFGTEDEQELTRLTNVQAAVCLAVPTPESGAKAGHDELA